MRSLHWTLILALPVVVAGLSAGCGGSGVDGGGDAALVSASSGGTNPNWEPEFDADNFDYEDPGENPYYPLEPGTVYSYEGETEDGLEENEVFISHDTKTILGVKCTVVEDRVWVEDELVELTYDWFALDDDGNLWYFGEESYEYEDGVVVSTEGSWEAGVDDAEPGVLVPGSPYVGQSFRQEYAEDVAEDMGKVLKLNAKVSVEYGDFTMCLRIKEWNPLEPGEVEHKNYAKEVGLVLVSELSGGPTVPVELVSIGYRAP